MDTKLIAALRKVLSRETGQSIELIETHLSWILLAPVYAYKLKKPVRLPFVDFSSVQARKHFCEEELRLNRRFAPRLYLDVVPVRGTPKAPRLDGGNAGEPIDHVVRMRRFAQSSLLRNLLLSGGLEPVWLDGLARHLAQLHATAPVSRSSGWGSPRRIFRLAADVLAALQAKGEDPRHGALGVWLQAQDAALSSTWSARQRGGSVRECHGDLHMGNVALIDGELVPFDCIEFDPGLRWIDVMSDVAFLTMDLKAHGRADLAFRFLDAWLQCSGDYAGLAVLRFYEVYRAMVRAMTCGLSKPPPPQMPSPDYLACAVQGCAPTRDNARLMITYGLSGSGKSTLASQLLRTAQAIRIRSDVERKRLFGLAPLERSMALGLDIYTEQATLDTFDSLWHRAREALQADYPVIVDAAFLLARERRRFQTLAAELRVPFSVLHCKASPETLRHRLAARNASGADASEADVKVLERQLANRQPLETDEQAFAIEVCTEDGVDVDALVARWQAATTPT
ncbi:bifunctional aminoglycoside phosphotransferase/ATP-binding protein [Hydrogenophaga sp. BPS33]|uniref:bifunctional aminoglycoside phosphotransferase/ATP-binding protein n=1 Tax=Hydrogenophaga sp. BPS33 TaxID=2651974 RepID=UPI00131FC28B|nr:bifunctional aminoglycoside phosphotransferase/ATP-binding protein [Hydrogenophaga sp. BPS33]QHE86142.1 AAA family ATPase [Hydrogenophaga sp. BPS33]